MEQFYTSRAPRRLSRSTCAKLLRAGAAVTALLTIGAAAHAASVAFEAESANSISRPYHTEYNRLASGMHCVVQPLKSGRPPLVNCAAVYKLKITTPGRYHVWGRALWPNGCANSVDLRMDGGPRVTLGQDGTYMRWHWVEVKGRPFTMRAGIHKFEMLNREDGPEMDEFYFTTDEDYVPAGIVRPTAGVIVK